MLKEYIDKDELLKYLEKHSKEHVDDCFLFDMLKTDILSQDAAIKIHLIEVIND